LPPALPAEADYPLLALLGTVVGERTRIAVFLDEASKDIVHLRVGQERAGWTLRSVHGRKVDFVRDGRIATLFLKRDADEQLPANPPVDVAASSNPDIASYRAALHQRRGR
jgi:outer membrane protein TolC